MDDRDSIDRLVYRALRGKELVWTSPETLEKAITQGEDVKERPRISIDEALEKLFAQRLTEAKAIAPDLLRCPIPDTPVLYLYDQIRLAILFGLNGVAITFCGILVEYALKYTTYLKENSSEKSFDSTRWERFENMTLVPAIRAARAVELIDQEIENDLRAFAKELRNKYSHFNIQKITEGAVFGKVRQRNVTTGEEQIVEINASRSPTLQIIAKDELDKRSAKGIFVFADRIVQYLFASLELRKAVSQSAHRDRLPAGPTAKPLYR